MDFIPHTSDEKRQMLEFIGLSSPDELFRMVPAALRDPEISLPEALTEFEATEHMEKNAQRNLGSGMTSFQGGGAYNHFIPQAVNALVSRGDFATAYTPYQAEASQGTLQAIYEFQTLISRLTGMEVANASMYDGSSALAEAALMACRVTRRNKVLFSAAINPHYKRVLKTYLDAPGIQWEEIPQVDGVTEQDVLLSHLDEETAAVLVQYPNYFGILEPTSGLAQSVQAQGALLCVSVYPHALGLLKAPGAWGADIVVGDLQPLGLSLSFGGPYAGFIACKEKYVRQLPGRLVGRTKDVEGNIGYVLTLQTREQHIRRSKATSNICTNQALCALAATIYLSLMGPVGLRRAAEASLQKSHELQARLCEIEGVKLLFNQPFFNEFALEIPVPLSLFFLKARERNLIPGIDISGSTGLDGEALLVCATEKCSDEDLELFVNTLKQAVSECNTLQPITC